MEYMEVFVMGKQARDTINQISGKYLPNINVQNGIITMFVELFHRNSQFERTVSDLTRRINDLENK